MSTIDDILAVLATIPDPEMPISIVDLGLVEDVRITDGRVEVVILPTFVGCPALPMIEADIRRQVAELDGIAEVIVQFVNDPPWTVDRINEAGRASLREHGVTVPPAGSGERKLDVPGHGSGSADTVALRTSAIPCPFCSSTSTRLDSPFGPTRCRMIYYCEACRNSFEHMKRV